MNRRVIWTSLAIATLSLVVPVAFETPGAQAEGVFERALRLRLERFCSTPLAKRRPAACRRLPGWTPSSSSSSSSSAGPVVRPPVSSSSSSRSSSSASIQPGFDTRPAENVESRIQLLGTTTPTLAVAEFTSLTEPLTADSITIELAGAVDSLDTIKVYDIQGRFIANASLDNIYANRYRATVPVGALMIDKGKETSIYLRGILRPYQSGGVSGEAITVTAVTLGATGDWSTEHYSVSTTETIPSSQTSRATITGVTTNNAGNWPLTTGTNQILWDFNVSGQHGDGEAVLRIDDLAFTLSSANVSLTNVRLQVADGDASTPCLVSGNELLCSSIPPGIGTVPRNDSLRLRVYADVAVIGTPLLAYVQLSLGQSGSPSTAGAITWTDGSTTFEWVALDSPVGIGPRFTQ